MLAVAAFVVFWILIALGIFLFATRGTRSERRAARGPSRTGTQMVLTLFVATAVVFGIGLPLLMLVGNHDNANAQVTGVKLTASEKNGRELFGEHCGVCHTLAAASTAGKVGPNLDMLRPAASIVLHTINNGCLPNPPKGSAETCLGQGVMPADVVQGSDANDVAMFVAKATGASTALTSASSSSSSATSSSSSTTSTSSSATTTSTSSSSSAAPSSAGKSSAAVKISAKKIPGLGSVLVDAQGRTLYTFAPDKAKKVTCVGSCAAVWPPVKIAAGAKAKPSGAVKASLLGSDPDPSGGKVVTYAGWPLYLYVADTKPGAHAGQAINLNGGNWYVISPAGKVIKKK